jgi:hypothetical protein
MTDGFATIRRIRTPLVRLSDHPASLHFLELLADAVTSLFRIDNQQALCGHVAEYWIAEGKEVVGVGGVVAELRSKASMAGPE